MRKRMKKRKKKEMKDRIVGSVSGRPAMILKRLHKQSGGRRSYANIIGDMTKNIETPNDRLIKASGELLAVCNTYFNPEISKLVEHLNLLIIQSARGIRDPVAIDKTIVEILSQPQPERVAAPENKTKDVWRTQCAVSKHSIPKSKRAVVTPELSEKDLEKRVEAKRLRIHNGMKPRDPIDIPKFNSREEFKLP